VAYYLSATGSMSLASFTSTQYTSSDILSVVALQSFKVLSLHQFYSTCTPMMCQSQVAENIHGDNICLATRGQYFSELEYSLSSDMAQMSHFCRQWRLKPGATKTISSVFHLHNTSATRELSVYLDGQHLRHECHPTYLGMTLDRTLSYRQHLTNTAGKLKNRNNLLMKLASSIWGASANTAVICSGTLLFSSRVLHPSLVTICSHKSGRCAVELYDASRLWYPPFYTSPMASSALQH